VGQGGYSDSAIGRKLITRQVLIPGANMVSGCFVLTRAPSTRAVDVSHHLCSGVTISLCNHQRQKPGDLPSLDEIRRPPIEPPWPSQSRTPIVADNQRSPRSSRDG
jgi:hypothetical protein